MLAVVGKERPEVLALEKMVVFDRCRTTFLEDRRRKTKTEKGGMVRCLLIKALVTQA